MFPKLSVLSATLALALAGCASQQSLTEQTQPMHDRLAALEQAIKAANDAGKARDAAMNSQIDALAKAVKVLVANQGQQGSRSDQLAQRLDKSEAQATALAGRLDRSETALDKLAVAAPAIEQGAENQQKLTERVAQAEQRLDELASTLPTRLAEVEQRLDALDASVREAMMLATQENIRVHGKEAFSVQLTEDKTLYPLNSPDLGSQDIAKLDDLIGRLAALNQEYHLDIQGHTDNIGTEDYNYDLGKARADVVKRYLSEKKGISLNRMSVISYGASSPLDRSSNHNRRIVIRVLVLKQAH